MSGKGCCLADIQPCTLPEGNCLQVIFSVQTESRVDWVRFDSGIAMGESRAVLE